MNSYCSIPWVHLRLDPSGKNGLTGVSPCCKFYYEEWQTINPDNSVTDGIGNALNTRAFQGIRQDMLRGNPIKGCQNCYSDEAAGLESMRTQANRSWKLNDLSTDYLHTKFIEVSLDNTCNLECKMCDSSFSSKLRRRDRLLGNFVAPNTSIDPDLLDELDLSQVEQVKFVGGEPLLSKHHLPFLQKFPDIGQLSLLYNTNATIVPSGPTRDIMASAKELNFIISCDGIYKYNDYQRWGSDFETIIRNAETIRHSFDNIKWFTFLNTFTLLNLNNYSDTIAWFKENNLETFSNWGEGPLSVEHAPDWYEEWILETNDSPEVREYFQSRTQRKYNPERWTAFIDLIKATDLMYGTRLEDYNPELAAQLNKHSI
jgi:MoaA/NifB/PqqE/SkfB family radical SAM enzyme